MKRKARVNRPNFASQVSAADAVELATQRSKYSTESLMMMLDREKLEALEEEFNEHPDGIKLPNFVWLMKMAMNDVDAGDKAELILGLCQLFDEIDINGDEHMEWSEFTQYIIDTVMGQNDKGSKDNREQTITEILESAKSHKTRRYQLSPAIDRSLHSGPIRQIMYYPSIDLVSVVEMGSKQVKLYSTDCELKKNISPEFKDANFVLGAAYKESDKTWLLSASNKKMYVYTDDLQGGFKQTRKFRVKESQTTVWYFEKHNMWVSAGTDHLLRQWDIKNGLEIMCYDSPADEKPTNKNQKRKNRGHNATIMDAIEMEFPYMIATAGLDGFILIWDFITPRKNWFRKLDGKHNLGIRCLDYSHSPGHGTHLLSVGYEKHVNIWSPSITLSDQCYTGKLEGHSCPVVSCKIFTGWPVCVSVDEKGNVRIWDIRYFQCFQIITHERGKLEIAKLITIPKHDKFIIGGKRLFAYEPLKELAYQTTTDDIIPIQADFNTYYLQITVLTKYDIRIYDAVNGKLLKIFTDVQDVTTGAELSAFTFDNRNRKFILGDNAGGLRVYNCSNGAMMHSIRDSVLPNFQEEKNKEISGLVYCNEHSILISSSWDSVVRIYDQQDPENTNVLRNLSGGHGGYDISCLAYSEYYSLVASGSTNGIVSIWDFEIGKLEAACLVHHDREICSLLFIDKYPLLVSSAHDHTVCVWGIRPLSPGRYDCLMRFTNKTWFKNRDLSTTVLKMYLAVDEMKGITQVTRTNIRRQKIGEVEKKPKLDWRTQRKIGNATPALAAGVSFMAAKHLPTVNFDQSSAAEEDDDDSVLSDEVDYTNDADFEYVEEPGESIPSQYDAEIKQRMYIYIGDEKGWIKIWSADQIVEHLNVSIYKPESTRPSYNPKRRDDKNGENELKFWTNFWNNRHSEGKIVKRTPVEAGTLVKEWQGHAEAISSIVTTADPQGLVSCAMDKTVKIWSRQGECWGTIDLVSSIEPATWNFPYDWEKKKAQDVQKVVDVLQQIDEEIDFDPNQLRTQTAPAQNSIPMRRQQRNQNTASTRPGSDRKKEEERKDIMKPGDYLKQAPEEDDDDESVIERRPIFSKSMQGYTKSLSDKLDMIDKKHRKLERKLKDEQKEKETNIDGTRIVRRRNKYGPISNTRQEEELLHLKGSMSSTSTALGLRQKAANNTAQNQVRLVIEETYMTSPSPMANMRPNTRTTHTASTPNLPKQEKKPATAAPVVKKQPLAAPIKTMTKQYGGSQSTSNLNLGTERKRPVLGYSASRVPVNRFYMERLGTGASRVKTANVKKRRELPFDIRFRSGESARMMQQSVTRQHMAATAQIAPYTEDIAVLQKKNDMIRTFSAATFRKNLKTEKPKVNIH